MKKYPRTEKYDPAWIAQNWMGPNPLWLLEELCEHMELKPDMRVLDMGCGKGITSVFLAKEYGVTVFANDLWISATDNLRRFEEAGVADKVFPIHAEAHALPYAEGFFDVAISIDSYEYYGADEMYFPTIYSKSQQTLTQRRIAALRLALTLIEKEQKIQEADSMPRPTTKGDLLLAANSQFDKLFALIGTLPEGRETVFTFDPEKAGKEAHWARDKNLRDVFIHLYEWHKLLLAWVSANQKGESRPFLPEPYTWKNYAEMNVSFWESHQSTPLDDAEKLVRDSHKNVIALIEAFSDDELFTKKHFPWTGTTNLGSYCISATSSHYDWAMKKVKTQLKERED